MKLGKIIQISSCVVLNQEINKETVLIYALTDQGRVYEYLVGAWVELNPLNSKFLHVLRDGQLVRRGVKHGNGAALARD